MAHDEVVRSESAGCAGREACLVRQIFTLHHLMTRVGDRLSGSVGLTASRWLLLCAIGDGEPVTVGELSERASLSVQAVSRMLAVMEGEGLVRRWSRPGSGRSVYVSLTGSGVAALGATGALAERFEAGFLRGLSEADVAELGGRIAVLIENLGVFEQELMPCER
jgi:DNA-binding MarR family transcriptional regulator